MTYEIKFSSQATRFSSQATRFFRKLQLDVQNRLKEKFREIAENPSHFLEHYEGDYDKIRIGDFRALVDVDNINRIIWIRIFDKRGRIYK